jgi:uncharacterized membrane protein YkvA (DUF1232 family)
VVALYLAARDPRVPWYAKVVAAVVAAYALSPIDLIPDFIPVLGYLDDLILVPLGIALAIRLIPPALLEEHRETAATRIANRPTSRIAATLIISIWIVLALVGVLWVGHRTNLLPLSSFPSPPNALQRPELLSSILPNTPIASVAFYGVMLRYPVITRLWVCSIVPSACPLVQPARQRGEPHSPV